MASEKISALGALGTSPDVADLLVMVDVSDLTMAASGTTKNMTIANLQAAIISGTTNRLAVFTGANSIGDSGWAVISNIIYPITTNATIGIAGSNLISTVHIGTSIKFDSQSAFTDIQVAENTITQAYLGYNSSGGRLSLMDSTGVTTRVSLGNLSADRINTGNSFVFGSGSPTAKVHIFGTGATSATFAFKVENSSGLESFAVRDDGFIGMGIFAPTVRLHVLGDFIFNNGTTTAGTMTSSGSGSITQLNLNSGGGASQSAFYLNNSDLNTKIEMIADSNYAHTTIRSSNAAYIYFTNFSDAVMLNITATNSDQYIYYKDVLHLGSTVSGEYARYDGSGNYGLGTTTTTGARATVKGAGNTGATNSGIFQNSDANNALIITDALNVVSGYGSLATTDTNGFLYISSCAGTPTGTPTTIGNFIPLVIDRTNNIMYIYSGGAWVALN